MSLVRVRLGDDDHEIRDLPVGDVGLGTVDAVAIAILQCGGGDRLKVRSHARLGHRNSADQIAADEAGQIFLLLLFGAVAHQIGQDDDVVQAGREAFDALLGLLVDHHQIVPEVAAVAAVFLRHRNAQKPGLARLAPELALHLSILAPLEDALFGHVLFVELAYGIGEDRDFLVFHELGLRHIDHGHLAVSSRILSALRRDYQIGCELQWT